MKKNDNLSNYRNDELKISDLLESVKNIESTLQTLNERKDNFIFNKSKHDFPKGGINFSLAVENYKLSLIKQALNKTNGNQTKAAKLLKMNLSTLNTIIKKHNLIIR